MKTAKSIIVVLSVLLTAQIASAYYCPSTGRWLSRDPIGEPGFRVSQTAIVASTPTQAQGRWLSRDPIGDKSFATAFLHKKVAQDFASYSFLANNSINVVDYLGLRGEPPGPAIHCQNPCQWAKDHQNDLGIGGDYGITVCCNGTKYGCILKPGGDATDLTAKQIITTCIQAHENVHVADPTVKCHKKCGWTGPSLATSDNEDQNNNSECDAWSATLSCLSENKSLCNGNAACEAQVDAEINDAKTKVSYYCSGMRPPKK